MSYVVDEDVLQALDAQVAATDKPMLPPGQVWTWRMVDAWWQEAQRCQDQADEALEALAQQVGWGAIVEALYQRGILHDDRWDGWYG